VKNTYSGFDSNITIKLMNKNNYYILNNSYSFSCPKLSILGERERERERESNEKNYSQHRMYRTLKMD